MLDASVPLPKSMWRKHTRQTWDTITSAHVRNKFRAKRTRVLVVRMITLAYYDYPKQVEGRTVE